MSEPLTREQIEYLVKIEAATPEIFDSHEHYREWAEAAENRLDRIAHQVKRADLENDNRVRLVARLLTIQQTAGGGGQP